MLSRPYFCPSRPKTLYSRIKRQSYTISSLICSGALLVAPVAANANPKDGQVTAGTATITQTSPNRLDIGQQSQKAVINWKSFSIGELETTNFNQPNASSITLNRVTGADPSSIFGNLTANGQVWLINPNGIVFGKTARVDVSGLLATTLDISDNDFMSGRYKFSSAAATGAMVVNEGEITVRQAGLAALVAPGVENSGIIQANLGYVRLSSAAGFTLDLYGDGIFNFLLDEKVTEAITGPDGSRPAAAVANSGQLIADGGKVVLSANVARSVIDHAINMDGLIQATSVKESNGVIILDGGSEGIVAVSGALDASAPDGGDGGFIETSGAFVKVADTATVTTLAAEGKTGTWLIDPNDFTIAATGENITGEALSANLANNSVTISTATQGTTGGNGDIFVNAAVSWGANTTLALDAERNIEVNANITATGNTAGLTLGYGSGGEYSIASGKKITLSGSSPVLKIGTAGSEQTYIVINSLGVEGDTSTTTLQGMKNNLSGRYALGSDIDASTTSGWNSDAGFEPVGDYYTTCCFTGIFDGLGHTVTGLTINRPAESFVGLFGSIYSAFIINRSPVIVRNVGLAGGSVTGNGVVGGLVGESFQGTISNSYSTGSVTGSSSVGGLVGFNNDGTISNSYSTGSVTGNNYVGGLVGTNHGTISNSYSTGSVTGNNSVGGLVGYGDRTISNSYSTGSVTGSSSVGGLVGHGFSTISNSYSTGSVTGNNYVGGLVGYGWSGSTLNDSYWDTETSGQSTSAGGTGLTTAQLKSGLPAGFDSAIWSTRADVNSGYPYLKWQSVSAPEPTPEPEPTPAPEPQAPNTNAQITALNQCSNVSPDNAMFFEKYNSPDFDSKRLNIPLKISNNTYVKFKYCVGLVCEERVFGRNSQGIGYFTSTLEVGWGFGFEGGYGIDTSVKQGTTHKIGVDVDLKNVPVSVKAMREVANDNGEERGYDLSVKGHIGPGYMGISADGSMETGVGVGNFVGVYENSETLYIPNESVFQDFYEELSPDLQKSGVETVGVSVGAGMYESSKIKYIPDEAVFYDLYEKFSLGLQKDWTYNFSASFLKDYQGPTAPNPALHLLQRN